MCPTRAAALYRIREDLWAYPTPVSGRLHSSPGRGLGRRHKAVLAIGRATIRNALEANDSTALVAGDLAAVRLNDVLIVRRCDDLARGFACFAVRDCSCCCIR